MRGLGQSIYQKGGLDMLIRLVKAGKVQIADAAKELEMSETEFSELLIEKSYELMDGRKLK